MPYYISIAYSDKKTFDNLKDMEKTLEIYKRNLSKPYYNTLLTLSKYSRRVLGVSHLKQETIAKDTGKSIKTIGRHIKYLLDNGYITIQNTLRQKSGGKGANLYVINNLDMRKEFVSKNKVPIRMKRVDTVLCYRYMILVKVDDCKR